MKTHITIITAWLIILFAGSAGAEFPTQLGGFTIGDNISKYESLVQMTTCREMSRTPYLVEGEIIPRHGFKSGMVTYGLCDRPNQILRIKLKFEDSSKKFFSYLLDLYSEKFGSPGEYKGDPFQTRMVWKWSFTNKDNERISLILQHNKLIENQKIGTSVKMTLISQIEKEKECYMETRPVEPPQTAKKTKLSKKELLDLYVPK